MVKTLILSELGVTVRNTDETQYIKDGKWACLPVKFARPDDLKFLQEFHSITGLEVRLKLQPFPAVKIKFKTTDQIQHY